MTTVRLSRFKSSGAEEFDYGEADPIRVANTLRRELRQWGGVEVDEPVREAGDVIIGVRCAEYDRVRNRVSQLAASYRGWN